MSKKVENADARDSALRALFLTIAARDAASSLRLLAAAPKLATQSVAVGATRADAGAWFFEAIGHHAYAGDTGLHLAAAAHLTELVRELIARGAKVTAKNRRGAQPLHYAADGIPGSAGWNPDAQAAVVQLLIEAGADPCARDKSGVAPLHRAVRTRSSAAVRTLLEHGADARLRNDSGSTPLDLATHTTGRGGTGQDAAHAEQQKIIQLLLDHGAVPRDDEA